MDNKTAEVLKRVMELDNRLDEARGVFKTAQELQAELHDELEQACGLQLWATEVGHVPQWRWYRRVSGSRFSQYFDSAHEAYMALLDDLLEWQE